MRPVRLVVIAIVAALAAPGCFGTGDPSHEVVAFFTDVGDLVEGGGVQLKDVEVGSVDHIKLLLQDGEMVARVEMSIDPELRVPATDLQAVIRQTSLLGEQFVELVPTDPGSPYLGAEPHEIPLALTERRVDIETFLADLSSFIGGGGLESLNRFTHAQAVILEGRGHQLGEVIEELDTFTSVLAARKEDVGAAIDDLASASETFARNKDTLDRFFDSAAEANALLADQGSELTRLFSSLRRWGDVNSRFLAKHEDALNRQFKALRPVLSGLAGAEGELRVDITQLRKFFELFPQSLGGGPGGDGGGDYIQADAVLCQTLGACHTSGEKGDVPGEGS